MNLLRILVSVGCVALIAGSALAQGGLLEKGKGKGNQGGDVKGGSPPQKSPPPGERAPPPQPPPVKSDPPRQPPPVRNDPPPRQDVLGKERGKPPVRGDDQERGAPPARGGDPKPPVQVGNDQRNGQQGGPPLGRVERTQRGDSQDVGRSQRGDDSLLGRRDGSRSGRVQYGTVNNKSVRDADPQAFRVGSSTILDVRSGSLQFQVRREDNVRRVTNYRVGYVQYDSRWCDDYFSYPYYAFTPTYNQCVISPWYYYPQLPGYLVINRITIIQSRPCTFVGTYYNWSRSNDYSYGNGYRNGYGNGNRSSDLDYALEDLVSTFERPDRRAMDRLIPSRGSVSIALEGQFAYSMDVEDFYDMFLDASQSSRTRNYEILDVRTNRDEATVMARHDYIDPWGRSQRVYHYLRLVRERGEYVIREFGTSSNRFAY